MSPPGSGPRPTRWLVDGMNVIGTRPDGWWRDRPGAMRRLALGLRALAEATGEELAVVFDGRPVAVPDPGPVEVAFAPHADDEIASRAAADGDPGSLTVVTSDAELTRRVRASGARVEGAGAFRRRLERGA